MDILLSDIKKKRLLEIMPFSTTDAAIAGVENDSVMHPEATLYASRGIVKSKIVNTNYASKPYELVLVDTYIEDDDLTEQEPIIINLPLASQINNGEYVEIFDLNRYSSRKNIIIRGQGSTIENNTSEYHIDINGYYAKFVYYNGNYRLIDNLYAAGGAISGGSLNYIYVDSDYECFANQFLSIDTEKSNINITLPDRELLKNGDFVEIYDYGKNAHTNNITVFRNDNTIEKKEKDIIIDVSGYHIKLVYKDGNFSIVDNFYTLDVLEGHPPQYIAGVRDFDFDALPNTYFLVDTSSNDIEVTLPHDDDINDGDIIEIYDFKRNASVNNIVIKRNNNKIEDANINIVIDVPGYSIKLVYFNGSYYLMDNIFSSNITSGQSAYDLWLSLGNTGTEQDFLESFKAEPVKSPYDLWLSLGNTGTEQDFLNSLKAEAVKSPYELWLDQGFEGTEQDFLDSLRGDALKVKNIDDDYTILDKNEILLVDSRSKSITISLPISGSDIMSNGDFVDIIDIGYNAFNNNIIIDNNDNLINYQDKKLYIDVNGYHTKCVYNNGNYHVIDNIMSLGGYDSIVGNGIHVSVKNVDFVANPNELVLVDTISQPILITMPPSGFIENGDIVEFYDFNRNSSINNIIIEGNDSTIEGSDEDFLLDFNGYHVRFVYRDNNYHLIDNLYSTGGFVGKSAYQVWLDQGNIGTENDFLNSLKMKSNVNIVKTSINYNANIDDMILIDTTNNHVIITLPSDISIKDGDVIELIDVYGNAFNNNVILSGYDINIEGNQSYILNVNGFNVKLLYYNGMFKILDAFNLLTENVKNILKRVYVTDHYNARINDDIYCDPSINNLEILLPGHPEKLNEVRIIDIKGKFNTNNIIVKNNENKINGINNSIVLDKKSTNISFIYTDDEYGWSIINNN